MKQVVIAIGIGVCSFGCVEPEPDPEPDVEPSELAVPGSCIDPTASPYLATPNVSTDDDRAAFQAAITAAITGGKQLCIPPGTFDIGIAAAPRSLDLNNADNLTIAGSGPRTVLKFKGPGLGSGTTWVLFNVRGGSENVTFRDFIVDGNESGLGTTAGDATHAIRLGTGTTDGAVTRVLITDIEFRNLRGAGVDLLGAASNLVRDVDISHCRFNNNHRAGVLVEAYVERATISTNYFFSTQDVDIDFQPGSVAELRDFVVSSNMIIRDSGCTAVDLSGKSALDRLGNVSMTGNVVIGGAISGEQITKSTVSGNSIQGSAATCTPAVVAFKNGVDGLVLDSNYIERPASSGAGSVVSIGDVSGNNVQRVTLTGGTLVQRAGGNVSEFTSVIFALINGVEFAYYSTTLDQHHAVSLQAGSVTIEGFVVTGSAFAADGGGRLLAGVGVASTSSVKRNLMVSGNRGVGLKWGAYFDAPLLEDPTVSANAWSASSGDFGFSGSARAVDVGGNRGRAWSVRTGAPPAGCKTGAITTRTDGGTGSTLYVCEGSPGAWVPK